MRCDLCPCTDGEIIEVPNQPSARNLRGTTTRKAHPSCQAAVDAHRAGEAQRTARELDAKIAALYPTTV